MAQDSTNAIVQSYFDAINASDMDQLLSLLDDDVVHDINEGGRQIGKDAFRLFYAQAIEAFDEARLDIAIMVASDSGRAAAEFTRRGTYVKTVAGLPEANGQTYSLSAGIFFTIDDGLITRVSGYFNKAELVKQLS